MCLILGVIHKRKIKNIDDAIFAVKLIIKIYKKTTPNDSDAKIIMNYYNDAIKVIQNKFHDTDLSLFKISDSWINFEFHSSNQYKEFKKELISKCEALKDYLESKTDKEKLDDKTNEQRIERLENIVTKIDERLDYVISELGVLKNSKKDPKKKQNRIVKQKTKK